MAKKAIDFTMMCKCGWEFYTGTLADAKIASMEHIRFCKTPEVFIDRCIDKEIDDTFETIIIK